MQRGLRRSSDRPQDGDHEPAQNRPEGKGAGSSAGSAANLLNAELSAVIVREAESGRCVFANADAARSLGRSTTELVGGTEQAIRAIADRFAGVSPDSADFRSSSQIMSTRIADRSATLRVQHHAIVSPRGTRYWLTVWDDITAWVDANEELRQRAERDPLTHLLDRDAFACRLNSAIEQTAPFALVSVDLDRFKGVNDTYGHPAGDAALAQTAVRMQALASLDDMVARVGGDEFAILVVGQSPDRRARDMAERLLAAFNEPLTGAVAGVRVSASIGIAAGGELGCTAEQLRQRADVAMYDAKRQGGGRCCWFSEGHAHPSDGSVDLAEPLQARLGQGAPAGDGRGDQRRIIVAIAEIDRFSALRQRIGYAAATRLIAAVSEVVRRDLPGGQVGRVGRASVEFSFATSSLEAARHQLAVLASAIEQPLWVDDYAFELTVTIGAADVVGYIVDDRQLDAASAALAWAHDHREKVVLADADFRDRSDVSQLSTMRDLREAMRTGDLALHYQPKLRCRSDTIDSAEALLRWHHPEFGLVRTDKLIEMAEATGAIRELTFWAVDRALADRARLAAAGHELTIYVNISGQLLADQGFAGWALARLAGANGAIGFEITETAVIHEPTVAIGHLHRFAAAGIKIAIDDYGSGLSSLAYLKQLPAHELKIDQMFVSGLTDSHRDPLLVRSSIDLAHALEMEVTAEGVDDAMSLSLLRVMGCDLVQGYLVSRPLAIDALEAFLRDDGHHRNIENAGTALHGWHIAAPAAGKQP